MPAPAMNPTITPLAPSQATPLGQALSGQAGINAAGQQTSTPTTLSGTAGAAGLAANPTTAAAAQSLGASPDAAKMAGTPNAFLGSVGLGGGAPVTAAQTGVAGGGGAAGPASLAQGTATGAFTANNNAGANSAAATQKQTQLANEFGSVGLRVDSLVAAAVSQAAAPNTAAPTYALPTTPNPLLAAGTATQQTAAQAALTALAANPTSASLYQAAQVAVGAITGETDPNIFGDPTTGTGGYLTATTAAQAAAAGLQTQMYLTPANMAATGVTAQDLTDLGINPANAGTTTIAQLRQAISAAQAQTGQTTQEANVVAAGLAGVGQTRALGREVTAAQSTGEYTSEAAAQASFAKAQQGETITIAGQTYAIQDLLNSNNFQQLATAYLQAAPGSALQTQLNQMMPSLANYITENQAAVTAATAAAQGTEATFTAAETANQATINTLASSTGLTATQLQSLFPDVAGLGGQYTSAKIDPSSSGALTTLMDASAFNPANNPNGTASPAQLAATLQGIQTSNPAAFSTLSGLSETQLLATGIAGRTDAETATWTGIQAAATQASTLANATPAQISQALFGTPNPQTAQGTLEAMAATATGTTKANLLAAAATLGQQPALNMSQLVPTGSLSDMIKTVANGGTISGGTPIGYAPPVAGSVANALGQIMSNPANGNGTQGLTVQGANAVTVAVGPNSTGSAVDIPQLQAALPQLTQQGPAVAAILQQKITSAQMQYSAQAVQTIMNDAAIPPGSNIATQLLANPGTPMTGSYVNTSGDVPIAAAAIAGLQSLLTPGANSAYVNQAWVTNAVQVLTSQMQAEQAKLNAQTPATPAAKPSLSQTLAPYKPVVTKVSNNPVVQDVVPVYNPAIATPTLNKVLQG